MRITVAATFDGTPIADTLTAGIPDGPAAATRDALAGAAATIHHLPDQLVAALLAAARDAVTTGVHTVGAVSATLLTGIAILIAIALRPLPPSGETPAPPMSATCQHFARTESLVAPRDSARLTVTGTPAPRV